MAIFAQVRHKSIKASVIHRKLDLSASLIPEIGNQIYFSKLVGVANWQNLYLHDVHVNAERTIYVLNDSYAFLDAAVLAVDKSLNDSFGFLSEPPVFTVDKQVSDTFYFSDVTTSHANKGLTDLTAFADSQVFDVNAERQSVFGFGDAASYHPTKGLIDLVTFSDPQSFDVNRADQSSIAFSESLSSHPNKGADDLFEFSDEQVFGVTARRQSAFAPLDQLTVTRQPYNFVFSQVGDVVTVTGEPDDAFGFADGIRSFSASKSLQDFFALDDFAQINKAVEGVKGNVFGLTEHLESSFVKAIETDPFGFNDQASLASTKRLADSTPITEALGLHASRLSTDETTLGDEASLSFSSIKTDSAIIVDYLESNVGKSIQNQLFSLTDQSLFALSKSLTEHIILEELLTSHASKSVLDTTTLNDAATLSPRIGKSDSTSIVDSLDVEHVVTGALLNQALIGNIILNAD